MFEEIRVLKCTISRLSSKFGLSRNIFGESRKENREVRASACVGALGKLAGREGKE